MDHRGQEGLEKSTTRQVLTHNRVRTKEPCVKSTRSCEIKFTDLKTLEGKILANRSSIHQIRQCFPPPTFHAIRYVRPEKVPSVEPFTGEKPDILWEDWIPTLERAAV